MKILYLISYYDIGDGASRGLYTQIQCDRTMADHFVLCHRMGQVEPDLRIEEIGDGNNICYLLKEEGFDVVHYFKARNSDLFSKVIHLLKRNAVHIPVITTVCQRPSYHSLLLTPFEIRNSSHFVFIDKASYNDPFVRFISEDFKTQIYLASTDFFIEETESVGFTSPKDGKPVVFGRGSTMGKCPKNMFDVFDKIKVDNKKFYISGLPAGDNWVKEMAKGRPDVITCDKLPLDRWIKLCASFDVFLYQLPENSYASIDGTLGLAMLMRKPVVYYGPAAAKERFVHGENGFVANTYEEIIMYATLLGNNEKLRREIGEKARESIIRQFSLAERTKKFRKVYDTVHIRRTVTVPLLYRMIYVKRCYKEFVKRNLNIFPYGKGFFRSKYGYK